VAAADLDAAIVNAALAKGWSERRARIYRTSAVRRFAGSDRTPPRMRYVPGAAVATMILSVTLDV
jgi:hypothetical protein